MFKYPVCVEVFTYFCLYISLSLSFSLSLPPSHKSTDIVKTLPDNSVILDASKSTDDDIGEEGLRFLWEQEQGPLDSAQESWDTPELVLNDLKEGVHKYKYVRV